MTHKLITFIFLISLNTYALVDFAHVKIADQVLFKSESEAIKKSFSSLECLFGETLQSEMIKKMKMNDNIDGFLLRLS